MLKKIRAVLLIFLALGIIQSVLAWSVEFVDPTDGIFVYRDYILVNVTSSASNTTNITIYLYDSRWSPVDLISGNSNALFANFTGLPEETYYIIAIAIDSEGEKNFADETKNVTIIQAPMLPDNGDTNTLIDAIDENAETGRENTKDISNNVSGLATTQGKRLMIILGISVASLLVIGIVIGLLYRNRNPAKNHMESRDKKIHNATKHKNPTDILAYTEEPLTEKTIIHIDTAKDEKVPKIIPLSDSEMYIKTINQLLAQCEHALNDEKLEEAKKYHSEAKNVYLNGNLDYEHKSIVYNKIIELQGKLNKN
jgi:hypothetical protein